jgi:predicted nucleic acid-binding Zn ribbon protein
VAGSARGDRPGDESGIGAVIRELLAQPRMRKGLSLGRLARSWEEVVGPRLAQETAPVSLERGALVVSASSAAWGAQVRFLAKDISGKANETLGSDEVRSVRVLVSSDAGRTRKPLRRKGSER